MADKGPTTKKTVAKKAAAKKAPAKKAPVKKAVTKKAEVKPAQSKTTAAPESRPGIPSDKASVSVTKDTAPAVVTHDAPVTGNAATDAKSVSSKVAATGKPAPASKEKSPAEKKALADKIFGMTGGPPQPSSAAKSKPAATAKGAPQPAAEKVPAESQAAKAAASGAPQPDQGRQRAEPSPLQTPAPNPMDGMSSCMDKFRETFEASARRWELIVYPSLLAFIILAIYGFYLIQSLTTDVGRMADRIDGMGDNMLIVAENMGSITAHMGEVTTEMNHISMKMSSQDQSLKIMVNQMTAINESAHTMSVSMQQMRQDISVMGYNLHSAAGPMRLMNGFMPW